MTDRESPREALVTAATDEEMKRFLWIGIAIWLVATLALRRPGTTALLFGITALLIDVPVFRLARALPTPEAGIRAVALIVLPGMPLDTGNVFWFRGVFPKMPASAGMPFAALLLWAYGVALLAGLT